jgi:acyl-coenzyme A thioesterase PaaI-like protein
MRDFHCGKDGGTLPFERICACEDGTQFEERGRVTDRALSLERVRREVSEGPMRQLLGAKLDYCENGVARISLPYRDVWEDARGDLSSGILSLTGEVAARLAVTSLAHGSNIVLHDIKMNYLGHEKKALLAIGEVVLRKPKLAICRIELLQGHDKSVAVGVAAYSID